MGERAGVTRDEERAELCRKLGQWYARRHAEAIGRALIHLADSLEEGWQKGRPWSRLLYEDVDDEG